MINIIYYLTLFTVLISPTKCICDETLLGNGEYYTGCQNTTQNCLTCEYWTDLEVGDHNYCRNHDNNETTIWCYTTDADIPRDLCTPRNESSTPCEPKQSTCNETMVGDGSAYRGCQFRTSSGLQCQKWSHQIPHAHDNIIGDHNYCRNPDGSDTIWCYTTNVSVPRQNCEPLQTALDVDIKIRIRDIGVKEYAVFSLIGLMFCGCCFGACFGYKYYKSRKRPVPQSYAPVQPVSPYIATEMSAMQIQQGFPKVPLSMKILSRELNADYNSNVAHSPVKHANNALVAFFGICKYNDGSHKDLNDIHADEQHWRKVFVEQFGYRFESNEYGDKQWDRVDAMDWIRSKRDNILIKHGRVQYNALIFCGASHGSTHAMICSDGQLLQTSTIRSMFAWNVNDAFSNMPKVFIFNCCRTSFRKETTPSIARGGPGAAYGLTMTGTEGNPVFGARLSLFVAAAFSEIGDTRGLYEIFKHAKKKAESEMGLALQEHDPDVDDVRFKKKPQKRGSELKVQTEGTVHVRDDDLRNVLTPYNGSLDLLEYFDPLRAAGFTDNAMLRTLTAEILDENNIEMRPFHQKELLQRIATLQ